MRDIGSTEKNRGSMLGVEIVSAINGSISSVSCATKKKERLFCLLKEFIVSKVLHLMYKEKGFLLLTLSIFATV